MNSLLVRKNAACWLKWKSSKNFGVPPEDFKPPQHQQIVIIFDENMLVLAQTRKQVYVCIAKLENLVNFIFLLLVKHFARCLPFLLLLAS